MSVFPGRYLNAHLQEVGVKPVLRLVMLYLKDSKREDWGTLGRLGEP